MRHKRSWIEHERATTAIFNSFTKYMVGVNGIRTFDDVFELIGGHGFHMRMEGTMNQSKSQHR
jgi:hypothetical protein